MDWQTTEGPLHTTVDLKLGEEHQVRLTDGSKAGVKLIGVDEMCDDVRGAVRHALARVEVNGVPAELSSGNYQLPVTIGGVQIDCPVTGGYLGGSRRNAWALEADARLRLWPAGSHWIAPDAFVYPARQRWFASQTHMGNEPVFVDGPEDATRRDIYYHEGLDFGGAEGMVEAVATSGGLVVSLAGEMLPGYEGTPAETRYDVVYLLDRRGWYHRYSHLKRIDPALQLGGTVQMGQVVGLLGKEGASGGWSHLHYGISCPQPSGAYGAEYGYPFVWQAYRAERSPKLIAVARPHHFLWAGQSATLDASKSWSAGGLPLRFEWSLTDGSTATGPTVQHTYARPGIYCETVKVTDGAGSVDYDFAVVQAANPDDPARGASGIHAAYAPTFGLRPGDAITFKVRSFGTQHGEEVWDFGDGSPQAAVRSDGNVTYHNPDGYAVTTHSFARPGDYIVSVSRTNERGVGAVDRLHVRVEGG
jgi:hypothetical protein